MLTHGHDFYGSGYHILKDNAEKSLKGVLFLVQVSLIEEEISNTKCTVSLFFKQSYFIVFHVLLVLMLFFKHH
jgi:hypothetical protein